MKRTTLVLVIICIVVFLFFFKNNNCFPALFTATAGIFGLKFMNKQTTQNRKDRQNTITKARKEELAKIQEELEENYAEHNKIHKNANSFQIKIDAQRQANQEAYRKQQEELAKKEWKIDEAEDYLKRTITEYKNKKGEEK